MYKDKKFEIISVSIDHDRKAWIKAIQQDRLNWTHVSDLQAWNNAVSRLYGITGVPANVLIAPDGKILAKNITGEQLNSELRKLIQ
jgi:hypothetical protein